MTSENGPLSEQLFTKQVAPGSAATGKMYLYAGTDGYLHSVDGSTDAALVNTVTAQSIGGVKTFTDMVKFSRGVQVASAAALSLSTVDGNYFNVTSTTGITGITSIGTLGATGNGTTKGVLPLVILKFDGILTITNSSSLILPDGNNIKTAAGDVLTFVEESAGVWRLIAEVQKTSFVSVSKTDADQTITTGTYQAVVFNNVLTDNLAEYSTGTGVITVAAPGFYQIESMLTFTGTAAGIIELAIHKNGTRITDAQDSFLTGRTQFSLSHSRALVLAAGDTIAVYSGATTSSATLKASDIVSFFSFYRIK